MLVIINNIVVAAWAHDVVDYYNIVVAAWAHDVVDY